MMPGKFYVRAFIKQYCEAVGLDSEEIFEEFKSNVPSSHPDELPEQLSRVKSRKSLSGGHSKVTEMLPKIVGAVLVIGVAVLIYVLVANSMGDSKDTTNKNNTQSEAIGFNESKDFTKEKETNVKKNSTSNKDTENKSVEDRNKE